MKVKVDGKEYALDLEEGRKKITLGERALIKHEYDYVPERDGLDLEDPDHVRGFLFGVLRVHNPKVPSSQLLQMVDEIRDVEFIDDDPDPDDGMDPTTQTPPPAAGPSAGSEPGTSSAESSSEAGS